MNMILPGSVFQMSLIFWKWSHKFWRPWFRIPWIFYAVQPVISGHSIERPLFADGNEQVCNRTLNVFCYGSSAAVKLARVYTLINFLWKWAIFFLNANQFELITQDVSKENDTK